MSWVKVKKGDELPANAILAGSTALDGVLYIGRNDDGEIGKYNVHSGASGGRVHNLWTHHVGCHDHGEILVASPGKIVSWKCYEKGDALPANSFHGGHCPSDGVLYVGRTSAHGEVGKLNTDSGNLNGKMHDLWCPSAGCVTSGEILVVSDDVRRRATIRSAPMFGTDCQGMMKASEHVQSLQDTASGGLSMEELASVSTSSGSWDILPENEEGNLAHELAQWQMKAKREEQIRRKAQAEAKEWRQQAEEAKGEADTWKGKAAHEGTQRVEAEVACVEWKSRAEQTEMLLQKEAAWTKSWRDKVEMQDDLCEHWRRMAKEEQSCRQQEAERREEAAALAAEWQSKAEQEESCRKRLEEEIQELKRRVEEEEALRKKDVNSQVLLGGATEQTLPCDKAVPPAEHLRYIHAVEINPRSAKAWVELGYHCGGGTVNRVSYGESDCYFIGAHLGGYEGTLNSVADCYCEVLRLDPKCIRAWNSLGENGGGTIDGQRYDNKACFLKALQLNPTCSKAWFNLGFYCNGAEMEDGIFYDPMRCYIKSLELEPEFALAWNCLGYGYGGGIVNGVNYDRETCYTKALLIEPELACAWYNLGSCDGGMVNGTYYNKKECFLKAVQLDPRDSDSWLMLGEHGGSEVVVNGRSYSNEACFLRALELESDNAIARVHLRRFINREN